MAFNKGELNLVNYYSDAAKTDLILRVEMVYVRDSMGFPQSRTVTRTWFNEDGSEASPTKISTKIYPDNLTTYLNEGVRRRTNLLDILSAEVLQFRNLYDPIVTGEAANIRYQRIVESGRRFKKLYHSEFDSFIDDANRDSIIAKMTDAEDFWLDTNIVHLSKTIRQHILDQLAL
jgi:hypothetical protein